MGVQVNREDFLSKLEAVQFGLSAREVIEQSSCFIFQEGKVCTYNDEVACKHKSGLLKEFSAAVRGGPLISLLQKLTEDDLELDWSDTELLVNGKRRSSGIALEKEILLGMSTVEEPSEWKPLHENFNEALETVAHCAGKDESRFNLTCVHLHPKYIEASDNVQVTRFKLKSEFSGSMLIRRDSIKCIAPFEMSEFSETTSWMHFRNAKGLSVSCRRYSESFPDFTEVLAARGDPVVLPKGIDEAIEKAKIFSSENSDNDNVRVELLNGKMRIIGKGVSGWFREIKKMPTYKGPPMNFVISPELFGEITKRHNECEIAIPDEHRRFLRVNGGNFIYVAWLGKGDEKEKADG